VVDRQRDGRADLGSPLVRSHLVDAADVDTFSTDGVVCLRGALDPVEVAAMAEPIERALRGPETADLGALTGRGDAPAFAAGVDHWRSDPDFDRFARRSPLPEIAAALLGSERVWLYEDSVLVKEPGAPFRTEFHTDAGYFHVEGTQACTFWAPIDAAGVETGAVQYVRGSHRWTEDFRPNLFSIPDPIPGTEGSVVPDVLADPDLAALLVGFEVEPGDVVVHHYRTIHGAPANTSVSRRRRAISVRYCGDDIRYRLRPGVPRKPHHDLVRDGDELGGDDCPQVWPPVS
jgi:ectoine hydroxylase-related dioxygenase (phytanoyl-CoA dioxygenase family)